MINHHISDLVSRINNARLSLTQVCEIENTKQNLLVLQKLEKENYIRILEIPKNQNLGGKIKLIINRIKMIKVVSTPGRRIFRKWKQLTLGTSYTYFIRTSKGILTSHEAISYKLGGEVLFKIF